MDDICLVIKESYFQLGAISRTLNIYSLPNRTFCPRHPAKSISGIILFIKYLYVSPMTYMEVTNICTDYPPLNVKELSVPTETLICSPKYLEGIF